jgi:hypothetical protein
MGKQLTDDDERKAESWQEIRNPVFEIVIPA